MNKFLLFVLGAVIFLFILATVIFGPIGFFMMVFFLFMGISGYYYEKNNEKKR